MTDPNSTTDKNFVAKSDTASIVSSQDSDSESWLNKALSFNIKDSKLIPSLILIGGILALSSTAIFIKVSIREISSEATVFN